MSKTWGHDDLPSCKSQWNKRDKFKYLQHPVVKGNDRCVHIETELHKRKKSAPCTGEGGRNEKMQQKD